jgi:hypothetical protein
VTPRRRSRPPLAATTRAALACSILAAFAAACGGEGPGDTRPAAAEPAAANADAVQRDLRDATRRFAALRRPVTARDRFTASPPRNERLTLSYAQARLVYAGASARTWALTGRGVNGDDRVEAVICLYRRRTVAEQPGFDGACAPARSAPRRGVGFVTNGDTPGSMLVIGLVPDGVERVRFAVPGERPRSVRVRGNYYETAVSGPGRASFKGPAGSHRFPFGGFPG